ncbi:MAG: hypothetical protein HKN63_11760 [Rhodobacteraceae bacterium]|nr:hypothetical protein [Paracoccaceae bacterium]
MKPQSRTGADALAAVQSSIGELKVLNQHYDNGHPMCARTIATVVKRMIEGEIGPAYRGKGLLFSSFLGEQKPVPPGARIFSSGLAMLNYTAAADPENIGIFHRPFLEGERTSTKISTKQWLKQKTFTETPGLPPGYSSRNNILKFTRNQSGAHFDKSLAENYTASREGDLDGWAFRLGNAPVEYKFSTHPERFEVISYKAEAIIRVISQEIIHTIETPFFTRA